MITATALHMRKELANHLERHGIAPPSFTPRAPLPPQDGDVIVEGYCSPASVDRERMRFAPYCWREFKADTPLLFRHQADQIAGKILELKSTDQGLYVRALVTHAEAKRCTGFSIAGTVHSYSIMDPDDRDRVNATILDSTLEEVTMTNSNCHPSALVTKRSRVGSFDAFLLTLGTYTASRIEALDLQKAAIVKARDIVEQLRAMSGASAAQPRPAMRKHRPEIEAGAPRIYGSVPRRPAPPKTDFATLVEKLGEAR